MRTIEAYLTHDGKIFKDENKAKSHDDDLLGQEIDGLLRLFKLDISRNQEFKGCLSVMSNPEELKKSVSIILDILNFNNEDDCS